MQIADGSDPIVKQLVDCVHDLETKQEITFEIARSCSVILKKDDQIPLELIDYYSRLMSAIASQNDSIEDIILWISRHISNIK